VTFGELQEPFRRLGVLLDGLGAWDPWRPEQALVARFSHMRLLAYVTVLPYHVVLEDTVCERLTARVDSLLLELGTGGTVIIQDELGCVQRCYRAGAWDRVRA
jgi:hypothetical protein